MNAFCWMVADPREGALPMVAAQFAQLFGLECSRWSRRQPLELVSARPDQTMVALSYRTLRSLSADQAARLRNLVKAGAVLYIRGGFLGREQCSLAPVADLSFSPVSCRPASEYRIETHPLMPEVLHDERASGEFRIPSARALPANAEALVTARFENGEQAPFLFAVRCGSGVVICDLLPDKARGSEDLPILERLADPSRRYAELGALVSARLAAGIGPKERPALNLTLDDRPANFDYLNTLRLARWLRHVDEQFPGAHVDFAWTPDQLYPARNFVETLKRFNTGIVWHGFKHHLNHRDARDLAGHLGDGAEMVAQISRRFGVRFQPIMVFPFESFGLNALPILEHHGFLGTYANRVAPIGLWSPYPSFMNYSLPLHEQFTDIFPVMRRHSIEMLTRDVMLSHAALNLPMITVIHPCDIGLRRWPYYPNRQDDQTLCDRVLSFAAAKHLQARSLQDIAQEVVTRPQPRTFEPTELCRIDAR
jgi:hypothetical protein